jgi:TIR domain
MPVNPEVGSQQFPIDCLISYHRADKALVFPVCETLRAHGIRLWVDTEYVLPGNDWRDEIPSAVKRAKCVAIFFGPSGHGKWQMEEWKYLSKACIETDKRFIAVVLPGGSIPDDLQLATRVPVEFDQKPSDQAVALQQLVDAIGVGNHVSREYHVIINVNSEGPSCCLASPYGANERLSQAMQSAVEHTGLKFIQTNDSVDAKSYRPDVVAAVRSTSILLADCSLNPVTRQPDPNVTFQMGLAKSLAKPVLMVTDAPLAAAALFKIAFDDAVEFDAADWASDEPNSSGRLVEAVEQKLSELRKQLRPPYLAMSANGDVGVVRADLWTMQSSFWECFRRLQSAGLGIHHAFRLATPAVHSLERMTDLLQEDMTSIDLDMHQQHDCHQVHRARKEYEVKHRDQVAPALDLFATDHDASLLAFSNLASRTANSTRILVERAQGFYRLLARMIDAYRAASAPVLAASWLSQNPNVETVVAGLTQVRTLAQFVDQVQLQAHEMLMCLLELVGQSHSPRESSHGDQNRSTP